MFREIGDGGAVKEGQIMKRVGAERSGEEFRVLNEEGRTARVSGKVQPGARKGRNKEPSG